MDYSYAELQARAIRESQEYKTYHALKEIVRADETQDALIREYKKLQIAIQMSIVSDQKASQEDMQRFMGLSTLLFSKPEVKDYLQAEMELQMAVGNIMKIISQAADLDIELPGVGR